MQQSVSLKIEVILFSFVYKQIVNFFNSNGLTNLLTDFFDQKEYVQNSERVKSVDFHPSEPW